MCGLAGAWRLCAAAVCIGLASAPASADDLFRDIKPADAFVQAARETKHVLINFCSSSAAACTQMDQTTWAKAEVRAWVEKYTVPVRFDGDADPELKKAWRIEKYPTVALAAADGRELRRWEGLQEAQAFLEGAGAIVKDFPPGSAPGKDKDDPFAREKKADTAIKAKNYAYAVRELLWCFDHGPEANPDYRLGPHGELPAKILAMEPDVPGVRAELIRRRDALAGQLTESFDPAVSLGRALDFANLCAALSDLEAIVRAFDALPADPKARAAQTVLVFFILDPLLERGRFDDLLRAVGNPFSALDARAQMLRLAEKAAASGEREAIMARRGATVAELARVYQAMLAIGRKKAGARLGDRILQFHPVTETYAALIERSARAGQKETAEAWCARAMSELPPDQQRRLVPTMGQIQGWVTAAPASRPASAPSSATAPTGEPAASAETGAREP